VAGGNQYKNRTQSGVAVSSRMIHDFGIVDEKGDFFEFHWETDTDGICRLDAITLTERGPRHRSLASIPVTVWDNVSSRAIRELTLEMGETERLKKPPTLKKGINRLSPLVGRELAVLLWALEEIKGEGTIEAILHGWRELAREERWWLYSKAASPGQGAGKGWRIALFHALSETPDSRFADPEPPKKKSPGIALPGGKRPATHKQGVDTQNPIRQLDQHPSKTIQKRKKPASPRSAHLISNPA